MKLRLLTTTFALLAIATASACATSPSAVVLDAPPPGDTNTPPGDTPPPAEDEDDVTKQPPHALGAIVLGETHASVSGGSPKSTPIVSASFYPDAMATKSCRKLLEGSCYITAIPKCDKVTTTTTGCNSGEYCKYDDACKPTCTTQPVCPTACKEDEVCEPSLGTAGVCTKKPVFDAGPLAFAGTTTPITMYPPYSFESDGQGAPFLAGVEITVQGAGAAEAGFEKFDEKFKATTFLQMNPQLSKIGRDKIFGTAALPVVWTPGADAVVINISGLGGTVSCKVDDKLGKFDVPRTVVKAALGTPAPGTETAAQSLSLSVARLRKEVKKGKKTKASAAVSKVQPDGWLELTTMSTETGSFTGCASTQTVCGETCCSTGYTCSATGTCVYGSGTTCDTCLTSYCSTYNSACSADSYCSTLKSCITSCGTNTSCQSSCRTSYPTGTAKYDQLNSCKASYCSTQCP